MKKARSRAIKGAGGPAKLISSHKKRARAAVRDEIANVIVGSALDMTKSVIRMVNKRGSVTAMRFLWSLADMSSATVAGKAKNNALSMVALTRRLGLRDGNDGKATARAGSSKVESQ